MVIPLRNKFSRQRIGVEEDGLQIELCCVHGCIDVTFWGASSVHPILITMFVPTELSSINAGGCAHDLRSRF